MICDSAFEFHAGAYFTYWRTCSSLRNESVVEGSDKSLWRWREGDLQRVIYFSRVD